MQWQVLSPVSRWRTSFPKAVFPGRRKNSPGSPTVGSSQAPLGQDCWTSHSADPSILCSSGKYSSLVLKNYYRKSCDMESLGMPLHLAFEFTVRRCKGTPVGLDRVLQLQGGGVWIWTQDKLGLKTMISLNCYTAFWIPWLRWKNLRVQYLMRYYSGITYFQIFTSGKREKVVGGASDCQPLQMPLLHCLALHLFLCETCRLSTETTMCVAVRSTFWLCKTGLRKYTHFWTPTHTHIHIHTHTYMQIHTHTHTHTHTPHRPFLLPVRSWLGPLKPLWGGQIWLGRRYFLKY